MSTYLTEGPHPSTAASPENLRSFEPGEEGYVEPEDLDENDDDYDPDAPDPYLVEHAMSKVTMYVSVALSATDDPKITELLEQAYPLAAQAEEINSAKLAAQAQV